MLRQSLLDNPREGFRSPPMFLGALWRAGVSSRSARDSYLEYSPFGLSGGLAEVEALGRREAAQEEAEIVGFDMPPRRYRPSRAS